MHIGFGDGQKSFEMCLAATCVLENNKLMRWEGSISGLEGPLQGTIPTFVYVSVEVTKLRQIIYEPKAIIHHKVPIKRQSFRYVAYSTWKQGIGKAVTEEFIKNDERALSSEKSYIKLFC